MLKRRLSIIINEYEVALNKPCSRHQHQFPTVTFSCELQGNFATCAHSDLLQDTLDYDFLSRTLAEYLQAHFSCQGFDWGLFLNIIKGFSPLVTGGKITAKVSCYAGKNEPKHLTFEWAH
jgi:hypothetical protein